MPPKLTQFLLRWINTMVAVVVAERIVKGIEYQKPLDIVIAALLLGILNAVVRPILLLLSLPIVIVTLGFFVLVINALLLEFVGWLMKPHFSVAGFGSALLGAAIITILSLILNSLTGTGKASISFQRGTRRKGRSDDDKGNGPVIDV
jgi:putative membrane protein